MKQGEVDRFRLTVGAEMNKTRPALIVNDDQLGRLPLRVMTKQKTNEMT